MTTARQTSVRLVLAAFLCSGTAALIYEVTWTRALSLVLGSTTYAVSTMLATFMAGLALGAYLGGRLADRSRNLLFHFGLCEVGIGLTGLISLPLIYAMPRYYLALYRSFHLYPAVFFALQILLCALVMAVPTTLMGATFPLVSRAITGQLDEMGRRVGNAYSLNTVGAVVGSLAAGFLLIPVLGMSGATFVAASLNLAVGAFMIIRHRSGRSVTAGVLLVLCVPAVAWAWTTERDTTLLSFYSASRYLGDAPYEEIREGERQYLQRVFEGQWAEGPLRAYRNRGGHLLLQAGGKLEGSDAADMASTLLASYLPLASHPEPHTMLVIGLGAGVTLAAAREHVSDVDLVEIHPGVLEAVSRFGPPGVLDGIEIRKADARNDLLRTQERYDIITSMPSYPSESMVGNLFTREYFELASRRLAPGGVYCQWLPYYLMSNDDVTVMLKTFGAVFPHVTLWKLPVGPDLFMIGSQRELAFGAEQVQQRVASLNRSGGPLDFEVSRDPEAVARIAKLDEVPINTDDHPIFEFRVAQNLLRGNVRLTDQTGAR